MSILVIHVNAFSKKIDGGYIASRSTMKKIGSYLNQAEIASYLIRHPETQVECLKV